MAQYTTHVPLGDLQDCVVQLYQKYFKPPLQAADHLFHCQAGFGCGPVAVGRKIFGTFLSDGEEATIGRSDVEQVIHPRGTYKPPPRLGTGPDRRKRRRITCPAPDSPE